MKRTKYCGDFRMEDAGKDVVVCGWVKRKRELGKLTFVDLRDRTGVIQLAFGDESERGVFEEASGLHAEDVICAVGKVRERSAKNPDLSTGDVEIEVCDLKVLSRAKIAPFETSKTSEVSEEIRLKYRYLELRDPDVQKRIIDRYKITKSARDYFHDEGFIEIETPMLIKSTPEGARDYLVPSRVFPGRFFALPQSPQLYKQLCMAAGFDKYFQITKCFRDEDLRADRQPEFTQIDFEASFVDENDIISVAEGFVRRVYRDVLKKDVKTPFVRLPYADAMENYGSDKPDLRFGLKIIPLEKELKNTKFRVFAGAMENSGAVRAINAKGAAAKITRKEIDSLTERVKGCGAKGLAFTRINSDGTASSSYEKFLSESETFGIRSAVGAEPGDVIFIIADSDKLEALETLGVLRCELARRYGFLNPNAPDEFLWVVDFPLFEYSEEEKRYVSKHHPFTAPKEEDVEKLKSGKEKVRARAYDLVLNGNEIGGGSIRINDSSVQNKVFEALGFDQKEASERFGFLMEALSYGTPPHGGMAFGLDRLAMLMLNCKSIRDVIAFPKVASSAELMTDSPGKVSGAQLDELGIENEKN